MTVELSAGDILTVKYLKDGTVSGGEDKGWFSFTVSKAQIGESVDRPAENELPTCTEAVICDYCNTVVKEALGHDEIFHEGKAPTCTENGYRAYVTCSRCDYTTYEEILSSGHSMQNWRIIDAPTCLEAGEERRDCSVCDYFEEREASALGHNLMNYTGKAPTCTEIGFEAYEACSRCDYTTYVEIFATGHTVSDWITSEEATCEKDGSRYKKCVTCHELISTETISKLGHNLNHHNTKSPTCTEIGWGAYESCSRCDYTTYEEIAALGHDEILHEGKAPTCTEPGWELYFTCLRCSYTTYKELEILPHSIMCYNAKSPTCTEIGFEAYEACTECSYTTYKELLPLGHRVISGDCTEVDSVITENSTEHPFSYEDGVYYSTNNSHASMSLFTIRAIYDCEIVLNCSVSSEVGDKLIIAKNEITEDSISGEVLGQVMTVELSAGDILTVKYQKYGNVSGGEDKGWFSFTASKAQIGEIVDIPAENALPTCTDAVICHYCNAVVKEALGHDIISYEGKAPTCTEGGFEEYDTCSRCEYTTYSEISPTGHTESDWIVDQSATCVEDGSRRKECTACHALITAESVTKLGHDLTSHAAKSPTCTEIGWGAYNTCSRCDYTTYEVKEATGHTESDWIIDLNADCDTDGSRHVECTICKEILSKETILMLGHVWFSHIEKTPTCTEIGWNAYETCLRCNYTTFHEIAPTGHSYIIEVTPPTCTSEGCTTYTCSCGHSYVDNRVEVDLNAHVRSEWIVESVASCTVDGRKYTVCTECHIVLDISKTEKIPHTDTNSDGICEVCNQESVTNTQTDDKDSEDTKKEDRLSVGTIIGITLGTAVTVSCVGFSVFWFLIKRKTFFDIKFSLQILFDRIINIFR